MEATVLKSERRGPQSEGQPVILRKRSKRKRWPGAPPSNNLPMERMAKNKGEVETSGGRTKGIKNGKAEIKKTNSTWVTKGTAIGRDFNEMRRCKHSTNTEEKKKWRGQGKR